MAVGTGNIDDITKAAITVRFANNGKVDVRDGSFYSADASYPYEPGVWYSIGIAADIANKTYDVEIGPCGEARETLIKDASFRDDADVRDELGAWAVWSSQAAALEVSTPAWMVAGGCIPATCESLGRDCGAASDGCGGALSCADCGSGQMCSNGVCVAEPPPLGGGRLDPKGRGPTGQWPPGFPAYASAPDIVTNGTSAGLDAALNDPTCADGCLIEHPGNITTLGSAMNSRVGGSNDEIVIRPPIGQRSDYTVATG